MEETNNPWISVKERMPDYYELVWVTDGNSVILSHKVGRSFHPPIEKWYNRERGGYIYLFGITHWKYCIKPEPPKEK